MKQQKSTLASIYIIIAGTCWGIIGVFSRELLNAGFSSIQVTASRCIVTVLGLITYVVVKNPSLLKIKWKDLWIFGGTGLCSIVFFNVCYFITITQTSLSLASILLYTAPFFVILLSAILFGEKITKRKIWALLLAFSGCAITTGVFKMELQLSLLGLVTGIGSGIGYGLYSIFGRVALRKYDTITVTLYTFIIASLGAIPLCKPLDMIGIISQTPSLMVPTLLLGVVSTLVPFLFYTKGLAGMESGKASVMAFVEPMVATLAGVFLFGEKISIEGIIGIGCIFAGICLLSLQKRE